MIIILAEDNYCFRAALAAFLSQRGHDVHEVSDGEEALRLQQSVNAQVLITDIVMPRKNGIETIAAFKQGYPNVRIVAISGGGSIKGMDTLTAAKAVGADATYEKGDEIQALLRTVESFA
jgi:DNA-binding NarL/FixJ family response regulator